MHGAQSVFRRSQFFINAILIQDFCEWNHKELGGGLCMYQGWTLRPAGKGGFPALPRAVGRGGFPAPPRPVKMIKTAGKLRGKIKARISTFSNRGNK